MALNYELAKEKLLTGFDESCQQFFMQNGYISEYGYSLLLDDKLDEALEVFKSREDEDIRAKWAIFLISAIKGVICEYPTYLELRDFLEIDLNILIRCCKGDFVEKIIRYSDFMFSINPEIYKFIGRVFYNNDLFEQAMFFLNRAKSYFYNDPELHCLLAEIYYNNGEFDRAKECVKDCLAILPEYYPAHKIKALLPNE